jgi:hypothetical protein
VGGKIVSRPDEAQVKFYCPPNKVLTNMTPEDVVTKKPYYTAKYSKIHEYVIAPSRLSNDALQVDASATGRDIYTPRAGHDTVSLHALFCNVLRGMRYNVIHCVFCRIGQKDRALIEAGKLDKKQFMYPARNR